MVQASLHEFKKIAGKAIKKAKLVAFKRHESIWYVKHLPGQNGLKKHDELKPGNGFSLYFNRLSDLIAWLKTNRSEYPWIYSPKEVETMHRYGHIVPFVEYNGKIIGYTKVALNRIYIKDYGSFFSLAPNKAMFYDTTVVKEFRGKKIPYLLKLQIFDRLIEEGIEQIFAHIESWNLPSIKSNQRLGFSEIGTNRYLSILGYHNHSLDIKGLLG